MGAALGGSADPASSQPLIGVPGENGSTGAVIVSLPGNGKPVGYLKGTARGNRFGLAVGP